MEENKNREGEGRSDLNVYEVSFLVLPSVAEEKLPEIVSNLKATIEESGGLFVSEDFPKLIPLAYEMVVSSDAKKQKYNQGYFGWLKFEIGKDSINSIGEFLRANKNILRHLIVETVKENTLYSHKLLTKKPKERVSRKTGDIETNTPPEEIDKSIEDLVIE